MMFLAACQNPKNEPLPQEVKTGKNTETNQNSFRTEGDSIFQKNGRLVFKDEVVFGNTMVALANMSFEEKQTFESRFEGYNSWRKYNQDNAGNENIFPLYFQTDSPTLPTFFTALVNTKREYQIGNTITYLEEGKTYDIPEEQESSLKQEGWFKASNLANFQTNSLRVIGDGKYQFPYRYGSTDFKQVFEVGSIVANGISILYLAQKLEYWGRVSWFRKDWRQAGEVRSTRMNSVYAAISLNAPLPILGTTLLGRNTTNVNFDNEFRLSSGNSNLWRYDVRSSFMEMFVPSHGQQSASTVPPAALGLPGLRVNNASFLKN